MTQRTRRAGALALAPALAATALLTACGTDDNGTIAPSADISCAPKQAPLLAAGSTAQGPAMDLWRTVYGATCTGTLVTYAGGGSGTGVQQFNQGKVAFAGSDFALKPSDVAGSKAACPGGRAIDLPMVAGLVSIVYNLDGVDDLVLDGPTLARIFDSQITAWNDPAIKALNPGADLPAAGITSFHRSDDSGTTFNLSSYFAASGGGAWPSAPNKSWQGKGGQSANGSAGVSAQIRSVKNSIGYVELSYAQQNNLKSTAIATGGPRPVPATATNAATTLESSTVVGTGEDLALHLDYGTTAPNAYPVVLVTYEIVCDKGNRAATLPALRAFLTYTASDTAQQAIADKGYVPLPAALAGKVKTVIGELG
ncbi:phosphate ABC transporter substrate-binding protein PstS [Kitasatospora viridis]|uniref:Phosphate-binding protein n=1 Tax=Kitasatospora viridis TaxID=281105 RepID=A0A561TWC4_9ACTN|nr:phosphate ABC transporter substrate-binding protein PstS [Kitasatospora viridis]TWF91410.1 phosphate ABC transporter substrate-binding protein (PhoT family) [Kitasatospora viridis]